MAKTDVTGNIPEYTVSEISEAVRHTLEGTFARIRVRGEITELKRYPSGHIYFSLKDEGGKIAAVVWRSAVARLGLDPENGTEVVAMGRISAYGERSTYQLVVDQLDYAGAGALLARIEALRQRLAAEGLFAAERKRALPFLPRVIGVVTSAQGAVIHDIRTTIARRFPCEILLWPVPVQGEDAAERIAAAISGFSSLPSRGKIPRPDVLIVARGGGSLEDLMAFNDEAVVRAAAASSIPLITAVGHETDTTLIDFAADRRAPTPTAAAELAVPARVEVLADLAQKSGRLGQAMARQVEEGRLRLVGLSRGLPDLPSFVGALRQRLDDRTERLSLALPRLVQGHHQRLALAGQKLMSALRVRANLAARQALGITARLSPAPLAAHIRENRAHLAGLSARLEAVSYHSVLKRGFVLVSTPEGAPVTRAVEATFGARLHLSFADGVVGVRVEDPTDKTLSPRQRKLPL